MCIRDSSTWTHSFWMNAGPWGRLPRKSLGPSRSLSLIHIWKVYFSWTEEAYSPKAQPLLCKRSRNAWKAREAFEICVSSASVFRQHLEDRTPYASSVPEKYTFLNNSHRQHRSECTLEWGFPALRCVSEKEYISSHTELIIFIHPIKMWIERKWIKILESFQLEGLIEIKIKMCIRDRLREPPMYIQRIWKKLCISSGKRALWKLVGPRCV